MLERSKISLRHRASWSNWLKMTASGRVASSSDALAEHLLDVGLAAWCRDDFLGHGPQPSKCSSTCRRAGWRAGAGRGAAGCRPRRAAGSPALGGRAFLVVGSKRPLTSSGEEAGEGGADLVRPELADHLPASRTMRAFVPVGDDGDLNGFHAAEGAPPFALGSLCEVTRKRLRASSEGPEAYARKLLFYCLGHRGRIAHLGVGGGSISSPCSAVCSSSVGLRSRSGRSS